MTKKEMTYEILSHTTLSGVNERGLIAAINKIKKTDIERIYNAFVEDKEHANFYFCCIYKG